MISFKKEGRAGEVMVGYLAHVVGKVAGPSQYGGPDASSLHLRTGSDPFVEALGTLTRFGEQDAPGCRVSLKLLN